MDPLFTPRNKRGFIDETIMNTPKPQASSTVERKGVTSYHRAPKNAIEKTDKFSKQQSESILSRDESRSASRLSTQSSLGILSMDNVENLHDSSLGTKNGSQSKMYEGMMAKPSTSITEKLLIQRQLAQRTIDRANAVSHKSVAGLPSYLLKPSNTPARDNTATTADRNESTVNLSELENLCDNLNNSNPVDSPNAKVSFEANEISARSSSLGSTKINIVKSHSHISNADPDNSDFNMKCQSVFNKIRMSDVNIGLYDKTGLNVNTEKMIPMPENKTISICSDESNSIWNMEAQDSLISKLQDELFTPAELATDKLMADELSWRREKEDCYTDCNAARNHLELSCFSGYVGEGDLSSMSRAAERVSIGEFFKRKTEDVGQLHFKASPEKQYSPRPLINVTGSVCEEPESPAAPLSPERSRMSTGSVMSVTQIAEVLANMDPQDTPKRMMDLLMGSRGTKTRQPKAKTRSEIFGNSSTVGHTHTGPTEGSRKSTSLEPGGSELKENAFDIHRTKIKSSGTKDVLKDTSNIPPEEEEAVGEDDEVIVISDEEWMEEEGGRNTKENENNSKTISSIAESPSISCSELEFTMEDDQPDTSTSTSSDGFTNDWVRLRAEAEPHKACVNVMYETQVAMTSVTNRWLLYRVLLTQVKVQGVPRSPDEPCQVQVRASDKDELLKYGEEQTFCVQFITYVCGMIELGLTLVFTDMVTKVQRRVPHMLIIESEQAEVAVCKEIVDFGVIPEESAKSLPLSVTNCSRVELPINLAILQDCNIFSFESDCPKYDKSNPEFLTRTKLVLIGEGTLSVPILMSVPNLAALGCTSHVSELRAKLVIHLEADMTSRVLKEVTLTGRVAMTKIKFRRSCVPLVIMPGQTKALQMKNSGLVDMELGAVITVDSITNQTDDCFSLDQSAISLKPNQSGAINVTFNPAVRALASVCRVLRLQHRDGPSFHCPLEGMPSEKSPKIPRPAMSPRTSLGRNSPRGRSASPVQSASRSSASSRSSSDSGTIAYLPNGKLPIESNRTELVWGCVKPGKSQTKEFIVRNRSLQRTRLQATITGTGFRLARDQSESVTSMSLVLHGMESRTIIVCFSPSVNGAATAKLMFAPIESDLQHSKRQMILLYGYGGHSCVDFQRVAKDPSGKMWLSFGRLDHRTSLEQSFVLRNTGSLPAFVHLTLCCKVLYPFMDSSVKISPGEAVIKPDGELEISVKFTPRQEDFKFIQSSGGASDVSEVASVQVVTGPEPTRGRIRRLHHKLVQAAGGGGSGLYDGGELLPRLCATFAGESMPADLSGCTERGGAGCLQELLQGLSTRAVRLTVERDLDASGLAAAADDTCMFQSMLCTETSSDADHHRSLLAEPDRNLLERQSRRTSGGFCTVEPAGLLLTPPVKTRDTVLLSSRHSRPMPYEIMVSGTGSPGWPLLVEPSVGVVPPGQTAVITVSQMAVAGPPPRQLQFFKVMVYVENEVMEIEVKVIQVQARGSAGTTPARR